MKKGEIIKLWKSGLNKNKVAEVYRRNYNQRIKIIRLDPRHRHERFITKYEALRSIEKIILEEVRRNTNDN